MDLNFNFIAGLSCGLCIVSSYFALKIYLSAAPEVKKAVKKTNSKFTSRAEYKMVLIVRNDLNMTKGKIISQCCQAALGAFEEIQKSDPRSFRKWQNTGQAKVAVKSNSIDEINEIAEGADKLGIVTFKATDDAKNQVEPDRLTCLSVGPAPKDLIDKITGHLKLL